MSREEIRREATAAVLKWIAERYGDGVADWWFWECTPMPCGLPNDRQLREGFQLALGELSPGRLSEIVHNRFEYELRKYCD